MVRKKNQFGAGKCINIKNIFSGFNEPPTAYTPKFEATPVNCVREYQHLMNAIGIKRLNSGLGISMDDFAAHRCIWVLDMTPEQCNNSKYLTKFISIYKY